jgi:hypothetical protein
MEASVLHKPQSVLFALIALLACLAAPAQAATPVQLSFFGANLPEDNEVTGVRFPVIYGQGNAAVRGLDLQIVAFSEMDSLTGISFPLLVGGANRIRGDMTGVAWGLFNWHQGQDTGLNVGFANITNNVNGLNWGAVNVAQGYSVADVGAVSISEKSNFQLSLVNVTDEIDGLQIGFLNCAKNGFLPCFVLFNFGSSN